MTAVDNNALRPAISTFTSTATLATAPPPPDDVYDSDDYAKHDTPLLKPMNINLRPSPSPPLAIPLPAVSSVAAGLKGGPVKSSQSDAVLVSFMGWGKNPEIAKNAGQQPLAWDEDDSSATVKATPVGPMAGRPEEQNGVKREGADGQPAADVESLDLTALAANALRAHEGALQAGASSDEARNNRTSLPSAKVEPPAESARHAMPSPNAPYLDARPPSARDPLVKLEGKGSEEELPPIRILPPPYANGNGAGPITLPSISAHLGDFNHLAEAAATAESHAFPQSPPPPRRRPPPFSSVAGHGSPSKSPHESFRRELPSPSQNPRHFYPNSLHRRPSQVEGSTAYTSTGDYSSSATETPSTDQSASSPAMAIDRMSIDGITNPQVGGFHCTHHGCTAQPFQTQYLLNSHANVHSSDRPHYCAIKGCPRSEGGKGFKRKNEMIRHGLVHESPGYVCPFCPDKEHKYPRPDNLQRHVRVHHTDKDKDDAQLREVLAQRPEGPSRGRRRRGVTS